MSTQPEESGEPCPLGPGDVLSRRYSIEFLIGEGSFGWVFSALDLSHALRRVALKVLRPRYSAREDILRRFEQRELALLLRVQQLQPTPHVVRALAPDVQRHGALSYLVLEFIDGPSLREVLDGGACFGPESLQRLGIDLARGLAAIHAVGGVHRDFKPANIRLRGGHQPVIVDFGTALTLWDPLELTATGQAPLTPRYASPEQLAGEEGTSASDVYAWGVLLHELLTGVLPASTGKGAPREGAGRSSWGESRGEFQLLVSQCLEYAPERRPTAHQLVHALSAPSRPRRRPSWLPRVPVLLLLLGVLVLGGSQRFWRASPPPPEPPMPPWSHRYGDEASQRGLQLVRDERGDLFVAGAFKGSVRLGNDLLRSAGDKDLLVARLAPDGTPRWSKRFGGVGEQGGAALALTPTGKLLVFGSFSETLDFETQHHFSSKGEDLFLVEFDASGHPVWSYQWGDSGVQSAAAVAVDPDGDITLLGSFTGSVNFGCPERLVSEGSVDIFLARLSSEGRCLWNKRFGDVHDQGGLGLDVDAAGRSAIVGYFEGTLDLGKNERLLNTGPRAGTFLAVFNTRGDLSWSERLGELSQPESNSSHAVRFDPEGQLFVLGDLAPPVASSPGIGVAGFSASGHPLWNHPLGDPRSLHWAKLALTARGHLLIAGTVEGTVDLGDGPFSGRGGPGPDLFVLELGRQREFLSARRFGGTALHQVWSVVEGPVGQPVLAGTFDGALDLGSGLLSSEGNLDFFIARLGPTVGERPPPEDTVCLPPPPGLSAWYPLDETDPGAALGEARAGRLLPGARSLAARKRGVLSLEGGFFEAPPNEALDVGRGDFSVSLWMRTSESGDVKVLLDKRGHEPPTEAPVTGYSLYVIRGRLALQLADGEGSGICKFAPDTSCTNYSSGHFVADGAWHHVTVTVKRQEPEGGTFYVDGSAVARFPTRFQSGSLDNPGPLRLGIRSFKETGVFKGLLDEVALWKRALSADEVGHLYHAGSTGMCRPGSPGPGTHSPESSRRP
jgi:hypothetical protein